MLGGSFSKKLLYRLLQNQEIKNRKVGREYRIPKKFIVEYLSKLLNTDAKCVIIFLTILTVGSKKGAFMTGRLQEKNGKFYIK
jgi:excisionase family DNA binding protein